MISERFSFGCINPLITTLFVFASISNSSGDTIEDAQITEFLASNGSGIQDADGDRSDWVEIRNTSNTAGDLGGWYLTDDPLNLTKWSIPAVEVAAGGHLVVYGSGKDLFNPASELHTNFRLQSSENGYLALVKPDGVTISNAFTDYVAQYEDISYGIPLGGDGTILEFYTSPTPGAANASGLEGIIADTKFSVDRGLHEVAFDLIISSETDGVSIRYTTDGSPPSETAGILYGGPISIAETTVIRAMAYRSGYLSTNVDTHTYIFRADVVSDPVMNTAITQNATYGPQMIDALGSIPTISLSFDGTDVDRVEIPVSVELLNFESGPKQVDAGAVRFGSYVTDFTKRSMRLHFRSQYGPSRLDHSLFEETDYVIPPTSNFDSLDLRAGNHDMIHRGAYLSNRYTDDAMLEMGNISAHGRFVHLYFNGQYRGQYHLRERWDAAMAADYLPGKEEEFDTLNVNNSGREFGATNLQELQDGDLDDWVTMRNLLAGPNPYSAVKDMLDVPNLIDFMLLWTMGNSESEFRAAGSIENGVGFKFFVKDADGYLRTPDGNHPVTHNGPLNAMTTFRNEGDPDFMTLLSDRIHQHFFNDGALTPARNIARLQHRVDETKLSYLGEAARWPSVTSQGASRVNRNPASWLSYQTAIINNRFPTLTDTRLTALKAAGMYPDIIAPILSQYGGSIAAGGGVTMASDASEIYYTLDGSDPRLSGGAVSGSAIEASFDPNTPAPQDFVSTGAIWKYLGDGSDQGSAWSTSAFDDSAWGEGPSQLGYGEGDEATMVPFIDVEPDILGFQRNATTYLRHYVMIPNPASFSHFDLDVLYDDGVAVYVNGVEVARTANLPANAAHDTYTTSASPSESDFERFTISTSSFIPGANVIAVELHNERSGSSDVSFDLKLRGEINIPDGGLQTLPVTLNEAVQFQARAFNSETAQWSALTSAFFTINSEPASSENLVISEIHYRPAEPTSAAELAISADRDDYEFIELLNIGTKAVELGGVHFGDGITFAFGSEELLEPGARAVLVRDAEAFEERYGAGVTIAGEYSMGLSNGGEHLSLDLEGTGVLHELTYSNASPWPEAADGSGVSLVLIDSQSGPDHALPESWGAHTLVGGSPGIADSVAGPGFVDWKEENGVVNDNEDNDDDGLSALLEYALGTSPSEADYSVFGTGVVEAGGALYATLQYDRNALATDLEFRIQSSIDLENWSDEETIEASSDVYRLVDPITDSTRRFLRLRVNLQ